MEKYILIIREIDRAIYDALKNATKRVETRANSPKYVTAKRGDFLVFKCGGDSFEKQIDVVKRFSDVDELLDCYAVQDIHPALQTSEQLKSMYRSFPNYEEKIKQFGIIAFELFKS